MLEKEEKLRNNSLLDVAQRMMIAARTAPKACGVDSLEIGVASGETIKKMADKMRELAPILRKEFFVRDAGNIEQAEAVVLIGMKNEVMGLDCGLCGYSTCTAKLESQQTPCFFKSTDLGIAIGSAVSVAADSRVDSRVMYSAGVAALDLSLLKGCHSIFALPISCTGKSPFFDRK